MPALLPYPDKVVKSGGVVSPTLYFMDPEVERLNEERILVILNLPLPNRAV
jgi:hypothetical protein